MRLFVAAFVLAVLSILAERFCWLEDRSFIVFLTSFWPFCKLSDNTGSQLRKKTRFLEFSKN